MTEKERLDELNSKMQKLDREKIEIDRVSEENKEIKNVMLVRIRELEFSLKGISETHNTKMREIEKEKAREAQIKERLEAQRRHRDQLQQALKLSQQDRVDNESS